MRNPGTDLLMLPLQIKAQNNMALVKFTCWSDPEPVCRTLQTLCQFYQGLYKPGRTMTLHPSMQCMTSYQLKGMQIGQVFNPS